MPIYEFSCRDCGQVSSLLFLNRGDYEKTARCETCGSEAVHRLVSRPALVRGGRGAGDGELRAVDPRRAVENVARQYDRAGVDPGRGFEEVARRAAAGEHPEALKQAVTEARKNDSSGSK